MGQVGGSIALLLTAIAATGCGQPGEPAGSLGASGDVAPRVHESPAAPRTETKGDTKAQAPLKSVEVLSTLRYAAAPDPPHRLRATYVFPDRVRWWLGVGDESSLERQMRFRHGESLYSIEPSTGVSRGIPPAERDAVLGPIEMRRALLAWPEGFEWKTGGEKALQCDLGSLGLLRVDAAKTDTRPTRLSWLATDGTIIDEFRGIEWHEQAGRKWPAKLELWHAGRLVWTETVESVDTATRYIDSYFLPPDRREGAQPGVPKQVGGVQTIDVPEVCTRRFPLPPGSNWEFARTEFARVRDEQAKLLSGTGLELDASATVEVDETVSPQCFFLRLKRVPSPRPSALPAEWKINAPRPVLAMPVTSFTGLEPKVLVEIRKSLPKDVGPGIPYVRFDPAKSSQILLLQPFSTRD